MNKQRTSSSMLSIEIQLHREVAVSLFRFFDTSYRYYVASCYSWRNFYCALHFSILQFNFLITLCTFFTNLIFPSVAKKKKRSNATSIDRNNETTVWSCIPVYRVRCSSIIYFVQPAGYSTKHFFFKFTSEIFMCMYVYVYVCMYVTKRMRS